MGVVGIIVSVAVGKEPRATSASNFATSDFQVINRKVLGRSFR